MASAGVSLAGTSSTQGAVLTLLRLLSAQVCLLVHMGVFCISACVKPLHTLVLWGQGLRWSLLVFISTHLNG